MALDNRWLRTAEDKEERRSQVVAAIPALNVLRNILEGELLNVDNTLIMDGHYDCPNWQYHHSELLARKRVLSDLIKLTTIEAN